ncbi:MAG: NAD(P)-dependent oxidoreductase [Planctomycetota bacterium]
MIRLLHIARRRPRPDLWTDAFCRALRDIGELEIATDGEALSEAELAERIRGCDILLTGWSSVPIPPEVADDPGSLRYVCNVTGSCRPHVPLEIVESSIPVTNWGDAPAGPVAEGAVTLLLACLKKLPERQRVIDAGGYRMPKGFRSHTLRGLALGLYGCGVIGATFIEMVRPFAPVIRVFDPYVDTLPAGCLRVASLRELFETSEAVALHAGLSEETRGTVTAELLALLPDDGVIVNTARGGIVDQDALFAELASGRLWAGLDVLEPDRLAPDHPARGWPNLILTGHCISGGRPIRDDGDRLQRKHEICLDNLRRHLAGEPVRFVMDRTRYLRST